MSVAQPRYDRGRLTPGIVHIGLGNFHRAHMATYLDDLFALGEGHDWAILGAGVRPADARMREALEAQDWLSTVIELDSQGKRARRVGAMIGFVEVDPANGPLIEAMRWPEIRIVSLTVTEGGYFIDPSTGRFDPAAPEIAADGAAPDRPATAFGAIVAALRARRDAGIMPFTVLSCDNLPGNGDVARAAVVGLARLSDPGLADWIDTHVAFPNAMVDRIAPATGPRERAMAAAFGLGDDPVPVTCEPFRQWVIEDSFSAGRPALEKVGVTFSPRVHDFETMKIRILNGGHAIIGYPAELLGIEHVQEAMADAMIAAFVDKIETDEIVPIVAPVPDHDLDDYKRLVLQRFANPQIADTARRLCFDGSNRQPKFIIPSIRDNIARGAMPTGLLLASALWCRYCAGTDAEGEAIAPNDPDWDLLTATARAAKQEPARWIGMRAIYGELAGDPALVAAFAAALDCVWKEGVRGAMARYVDGAPMGNAALPPR
ncbi:mannitol dehydrogenase family protein [Sphingopyxis sp. PAMC25046]|uniref:mannitol dehydrogenase family protein n=1 Tax=Sphingopyxis sp. PAMC25046 TaxID=2565556 RepID=UPI00109E105E|nr:mannitol dehydrogenase family protein [Sphingopyxis sp. PAMC25046]QCB55798.1 mannitol dehydrogenase family protein [Sphingopyxis sp. PAMC25046]